MVARAPLVFGSDGVPQQLQSGDMLSGVLIGDRPINLALSATVASNALTISVLGASGAAPSASNPVYIPFKAPGGLTWLTVTSALSLTIPSGATLGTLSGKAARIWIVALNNGVSPLLGVQVCTDGATAVYALGQSYPQTSVAISSTSGTAGTLYAASAVTSPITVLGCAEGSQTTAGTWTAAPVPRRWMPGDKLPGDVEQVQTYANATQNNQNVSSYQTGGQVQGVSCAITPKSAINAIRVDVSGGNASQTAVNTEGGIRITRGSTNLTLAETAIYFFANGSTWGSSSSIQAPVALKCLDFPVTVAPVTYLTQVKNDGSNQVYYPSAGTARIFLEEVVV